MKISYDQETFSENSSISIRSDQITFNWSFDINANLANNSTMETDVYLATIVWNGVERNIAALAMGRRPLIGTALLEDYHLSIDFCEGGTVLVDEIL
ncbi:MAG: hypothetical protein RMY29_023705 [Nostoc sp. CreGUA01]|nr:hypothetical protein [Nostoc sp. CreGUA01]